MSRVWQGLAMAIALAAMTAGGVVIAQQGGVEGEANAWVNTVTTGDTCTRSSTPKTFEQAEAANELCGSFDAAWDVASAGDTIRVKNGSYGQQAITGDKASTTKIIGESKAGVIVTEGTGTCPSGEWEPANDGALCLYGANIWIENVTLDSDDLMNAGGAIRSFNTASNVMLRNVDATGDNPTAYITGPNFTWWGGVHGNPGATISLTCTEPVAQPVQIEDLADGATIRGLTIHMWQPVVGPGPSCGGDNTPHLEYLRIQGALDNTTVADNYFYDGSEFGSGYIFCSGSSSGSGLKIIGNHFAHNDGGKWQDSNGGCPTNVVVAYNTWAENATDGPTSLSSTGLVWVGNLGPQTVMTCSGTHTKNVWSGSGSCGTDTFTGGAASALGIGIDGKLEAGSPAIDAAETPGASDYCTDSSFANSADFEGTVRPQGTVCDAGWDERE